MITIFLIHVSLNLCSLSDELSDLLEAERLYEPEDQQLSVAPAVTQGLDSIGTKRKYTSPMTKDIQDPPKKMAGNSIVRTATTSSTGVQTDVIKPKDAATQTISNICVDQPTSPHCIGLSQSIGIQHTTPNECASVRRTLDFDDMDTMIEDPVIPGGFLSELLREPVSESTRIVGPSSVDFIANEFIAFREMLQAQMRELSSIKAQIQTLSRDNSYVSSVNVVPARLDPDIPNRIETIAPLTTPNLDIPMAEPTGIDSHQTHNAIIDVLSNSSNNAKQYLTVDHVLKLRSSARSARNFAASLARAVFTKEERLQPNVCVSGWGTSVPLSPEGKRVQYIYETVHQYFYVEPNQRKYQEMILRKAIDEANRRDLRDSKRRDLNAAWYHRLRICKHDICWYIVGSMRLGYPLTMNLIFCLQEYLK